MREMVREFFNAMDEREENLAMRLGTEAEPLAAYDYSRQTGRVLVGGGFDVHPVHDWIAVSPDFYIGDDGGLEVKAPMGEPSDPYPWYVDQCALCMEVNEREWWDLYQWTRDSGKRIDTQFFDPAWFPSILPKLEAFMGEYYRLTENEVLASDFLLPNVYLRADDEWDRACRKFRQAAERRNRAQEQFEDARRELIAATEGYNTEGCGVRATKGARGWRIT